MNYVSTRDKENKVSSSFAIAHGISEEGGLFLPEGIPALSKEDFNKLKDFSYTERAKYILKYFLTDFSEEEIDKCVNGAYIGTFDNDLPAPISKLGEKMNILELWHGPTSAFKHLAKRHLKVLRMSKVLKWWFSILKTVLVICKNCKCLHRKEIMSMFVLLKVTLTMHKVALKRYLQITNLRNF